MKACRKCGAEKALSEFARDKRNSDGRTGQCLTCTRLAAAKYRSENAAEVVRYHADYRLRNRDRLLKMERARKELTGVGGPRDPAYFKRWYAANKSRVRARRRETYVRWCNEFPHVIAAYAASRRARLRRATPKWAQRDAILEWYFAAAIATRDTGFAWHVDHMVPLVSPIVCGLHCEQNLQLLPGADNSSKGNRYWPDMPT